MSRVAEALLGDGIAPMDDNDAGRGLLKRIANAIATMPTVQAIKEMVQYPEQVRRGEKQVPQTFGPEAGAAGDAPVEWAVGNSVLPSAAMGFGPAVATRAGEQVLGSGPIRAYHGSPHDFDRFDLSKIGTGEGAQAYGHGLYFAENEGVARNYRDNLGRNAALKGADFNADGSPNRAGMVATYLDASIPEDRIIGGLKALEPDASPKQIDAWLAEGRAKFDEANKAGRMYEVAIHADPERFLDWDKPLSGQPHVTSALGEAASVGQKPMNWGAMNTEYLTPMREVLNGTEAGKYLPRSTDLQGILDNRGSLDAIRKSIGPEKSAALDAILSKYDAAVAPKGSDLYHHLARSYESDIGGLTGAPRTVEASEALREAGIPGLRYLDGGSRSAGDGSRNMVLFDDKIVEILRKYGVSSIAALPPAVQMAIELGKPPEGAK